MQKLIHRIRRAIAKIWRQLWHLGWPLRPGTVARWTGASTIIDLDLTPTGLGAPAAVGGDA
jgi:hypothetical protein